MADASEQEDREGPGTGTFADYRRCKRCGFLDRTLFMGWRFKATGHACRKCGCSTVIDNFKFVSLEERERVAKGEYDFYQPTDDPNVPVDEVGNPR